MSKRDELIAIYAGDLKEKCGVTPDMDLLTKVTIGLGPAIYNPDSSVVSGTQDSEIETIRANFLIRKLGLKDGPELKGGIDKNIREQTYRKFYMHKTGHWLGLDVHDVGDYRVDGEFRELEPGMVVTVEPGLYIAPDAKGVAAKWRGIGIRIEDDVVVTRGNPEVITTAVPNDPDAIEALMAAARK